MYYSNSNYRNILVPEEFQEVFTKYPEALAYKYKKFQIDEEKLKELKDLEYNQEIYKKLDANTQAQMHNFFRYGQQEIYVESYNTKREELLQEQADLISQLK